MDKSRTRRLDRRDFMKLTIFGIGGIIAGAVGLPAVAYITGPAKKNENQGWIPMGSVSKVELNTPTLFKTIIETQTGWINAEEEISAFVLTENGQDFKVLSNVCTHLGCRVRWIADQEGFFCPCHNAVFAKDGSVVSGPPPRPLDQYENKVEDGILYIKRG